MLIDQIPDAQEIVLFHFSGTPARSQASRGGSSVSRDTGWRIADPRHRRARLLNSPLVRAVTCLEPVVAHRKVFTHTEAESFLLRRLAHRPTISFLGPTHGGIPRILVRVPISKLS
jgi:hypothetical protein